MIDCTLLAKYLDDECTPAEREAVVRWSSENAANAAELELLRRAWRRAAELPAAPRVEALWERIAESAAIALPAEAATAQSRASERASVPAAAPHPAPRPAVHRPHPRLVLDQPRSRTWTVAMLGIAATVVATIGVGRVVQRGRAASQAATDVAVHEYRTGRGERATVTLLDGTRVILGVDTRLRVSLPVSSRGGERVAYLEGEALFEVADVADQGFAVRAGGAVARDIGTTFDVRAYEGEAVRVVVVDGSVALGDSTPGAAPRVVLAARDVASMRPGELEVERGVDPQQYLAWSEGRLVFRRERLASVAAQLERVYDVRIAIPDSALREARVSAAFDDRDGIDGVLLTLGETLDAEVVRNGQDVIVRPRK